MGEQGWDPDVRKYFSKILNSFAYGLLWMMGCVTAGIYFELGHFYGKPAWQPIVFYTVMLGSLAAYLYYLYRIWKDKAD